VVTFFMPSETTVPRPEPTCTNTPEEQTRWFLTEVYPHDAQLKAHLQKAFPGVPDVNDLVQESYLVMWKTKARKEINAAKAYLYKTARNMALMWLRHEKVSPMDSMGDLAALRIIEDKPNAAELLSTNEKLELAVEALMILPERTRAAVILRKLKGLSQKEAAEALSISVKTVDKLLAAGLAKLEVHLRQKGITHLFDR
jgi:RNA polymerase sigma factor (sigma-70 family)